MPLRRLDEELVQDEQIREKPEARSRRRKDRSEDIAARECAREGVRLDAREDSRIGFSTGS